ncbi:MAG: cation:proton antiporter [Campylobacteraceae bacterium]|nr:cation:proton antiporter [Campylobacteraceae bacterium]
METSAVVIVLALLLVAAPFISSVTKIPIVVVEILLGVFGAYAGILKEFTEFETFSHLGFLYLMFLVGMEVNPKELHFGRTSLLKRIILFFGTIYILSAAVTLYFDLNIVYVAIFSIFSLGILMTLIKEYGRNEIWLSLALNVGIIGELLSIIVMIVLNSVLKNGFNAHFFITIIVLILFFLSFILFFKGAKVFFWWFPEVKTILMPYQDSKDIDIRLSMALVFTMVTLMIIIGIDEVLGAFLAGLFLTFFFKHKTDLREKLSSFGFGFFIPLFFIHVGSTLPIAAFADPEVLRLSFFVSGVIVLIRLISSLAAYFKYFGFKNTVLFSLSSSIPLTFLIAIVTLAYNTGAIKDNEYYAVIIAGLISAIFIIVTIKVLYTIFHISKVKKE